MIYFHMQCFNIRDFMLIEVHFFKTRWKTWIKWENHFLRRRWRFLLMADKATDISSKEDLSACARWLGIWNLGIIHAKETTAKGITRCLLQFPALISRNIDLALMVPILLQATRPSLSKPVYDYTHSVLFMYTAALIGCVDCCWLTYTCVTP